MWKSRKKEDLLARLMGQEKQAFLGQSVEKEEAGK